MGELLCVWVSVRVIECMWDACGIVWEYLGGNNGGRIDQLHGLVISHVWLYTLGEVLQEGGRELLNGVTKRQPQQESKPKLPCYWCNKVGHAGKFCPDKLSGKPFSPQSRAASWPDNRVAAVQKPKQPKLKVEKPKPKK